ncbi:CRP/FNR family cyclic AMP-dependent transcriptional regulator [Constrictibacter sp. MBR-5]|uniref:Crp/Fnr family transcriptional regulator n=1 Tax=Constrictibacter sp. MBR-5 TaxID=3156467 RepID=UPI003398EDC6
MAATAKMDKRKVFASHELFSRFSPAEIERLVSFSHARAYGAGEVIFEKGSPGQGLMAVLSGRVRISSPSPEGREIVLNIIHPGQIFGEIALLDGKERTADATAMEACELLILERRDFVPFLEKHPDICLRLIAVLCERLRRTTEQVEDVLFLDLQARLAKTLLHLVDAHGRPVSNGVALGAKLSQRDLANMIGASRESVNRQLSLWEEEGLISRDRGAITILDSAALQMLVGAEA